MIAILTPDSPQVASPVVGTTAIVPTDAPAGTCPGYGYNFAKGKLTTLFDDFHEFRPSGWLPSSADDGHDAVPKALGRADNPKVGVVQQDH
jgi:hypothetical protein